MPSFVPRNAPISSAARSADQRCVFDADGQRVASYDIAVKRDNGVRAALKQTLPGVQIEGVGDSVVLTGSVSSPVEAQQAGEIAARLVGAPRRLSTRSSSAAATG
jgi:pilus assembly protein CpaC